MKTLVTFVVLAGQILIGHSGNAQAQQTVLWSDGFEGTPSAHWDITGIAGFDFGGNSFRGSNNGWMRSPSGFNALTSKPFFTVQPGLKYSCNVSVYLRASSNLSGIYVSLLRTDNHAVLNEVGGFSAGGQVGIWPSYGHFTATLTVANDQPTQAPLGLRVGFWGNGADAWLQADTVDVACTRK